MTCGKCLGTFYGIALGGMNNVLADKGDDAAWKKGAAMTTTRTTAEIQDELAALTTKCAPLHLWKREVPGIPDECLDCDENGSRPLLEGVREPCLAASRRHGTRCEDSENHTKRCACDGKGWTASRDDMVYIEALADAYANAGVITHQAWRGQDGCWYWQISEDADTDCNGEHLRLLGEGRSTIMKEAFYCALEKALLKETPSPI